MSTFALQSDDNAHSSEGYGTDRGTASPDVANSSDTLPPTRAECEHSKMLVIDSTIVKKLIICFFFTNSPGLSTSREIADSDHS